jgi:SRSO17 transposase
MGRSAFKKKGPSYSFRPSNLKAVSDRLIDIRSNYHDHFRVGNHSVAFAADAYLNGLLMKAPRKNMERMEEYVKGAEYESVQHFISESPWDEKPVKAQIAADVDSAIGGSHCMLAIDESSFTKKGNRSVGVARQYNGRLGKKDNCQVGVFGALTDGTHASLVDARLYLPQEWIDSPARCDVAGIPKEERVFKTKWEIGLEIVDTAIANNVRFGYVGFDGFYGNVPEFLKGLTARKCTYIGAVHKDQFVYEDDPHPYLPRRKKKVGRKHTLYKSRTTGIRVDQLSEEMDTPWKLITIREGAKGYVGVYARRKRVWIWEKGSEKAEEVWLVIIREPFTGEQKYFISNAAPTVTLTEMACKASYRFYIERTFQDAKTSIGMADYQMRGWTGWHHHMAMIMLAMMFLMKERIINEADVSLLSCQDIVEILNFYLPREDADEEAIFRQLEKRHEARRKAMESAYRNQQLRHPEVKFNLDENTKSR